MTDQWEPVDLSSLDPARRSRWTARLEVTRHEVRAALERRAARGPLELMGGADALLHGSGSRARDRLGESRRLGLLTEASLAHGRTPSGAELRRIVGGVRP
jgi:hypothetical protein